jgi:hypothetical protein
VSPKELRLDPKEAQISTPTIGDAQPSRPAPSPQLVEVRGAFQAAIGQLKALGCEDSMISVEFWHALDCVNGEDCSDV